jgi:8-hydroxy-5-deazaflavin:NADPH oxidoreductase
LAAGAPAVEFGTFGEAAAYGEMVVNATSGVVSLEVLKMASEENLNGKILIDISNPLDFSQGMPPTLSVSNTDSLGEQIQRRFPEAKVVKTLHTMNAYLMVDPTQLAGADHTVFVSGDSAEAKEKVTDLLRRMGWTDIIDLGDITTARGTEMLLPIWLRLFGALQKPVFNFKIVR